MSSFCGASSSVKTFTSSELKDEYPKGILQSIGYSSDPNNSAAVMDSDGLIADGWIQRKIRDLEASGIIPKPTKANKVTSTPFNSPDSNDPLAKYVSKDRKLQDNIKEEYCFYESRYFYALDIFLQSLADSSLKGTPSDVNSKLKIVKELNQKLSTLTQIVNGIAKYRYNNNVQFQGDINSLNENLKSRQGKLQKQSDILNKESSSVELYKRMVEYTLEKNNANQNLLTLYGILNIVALGIIVYIARN